MLEVQVYIIYFEKNDFIKMEFWNIILNTKIKTLFLWVKQK